MGLQVNEAGFAQDQQASLASLGQLSLLALLIIFAMLASLLRSYSQPLIILAGIPFGAAGAFIGHFILGYNLSFYSLFGVVALAGVVVNDSLILVDRFNKFRDEGSYTIEEAVIKATQRRFRPIFITTATTSLGLMPLIFETSTTAQFMIPMAISLAIGILFAILVINICAQLFEIFFRNNINFDEYDFMFQNKSNINNVIEKSESENERENCDAEIKAYQGR